MVKTEGVSFLSMVKFNDVLDLNRIYSNDIHAIANTYGIEAAAKAIRRETTNVFAVYGITVNPRHLALIADYMTFDGTIKGFNRNALASNSSPIQQMTFETTTNFLKNSALMGLPDNLDSPSARIFAGRPPVGGTGILSLLQQPLVSDSSASAVQTASPYKFATPSKRWTSRGGGGSGHSQRAFTHGSGRKRPGHVPVFVRGQEGITTGSSSSSSIPLNKRFKFSA
jgi:hypothetical protein